MAPSDSQRARQGGQRSVSGAGVGETAGRSSAPSPQRPNDESWVEVASQPSSSSLSSIGEDIVTTGLRVGSNSYPPRRRRSQQQHPMPASFIVGHPAAQGGATSSQEEYDETESEEDRVMTSSTEAIHPAANMFRQQTAARATAVDTESDTDDDENATALGRPSNTPVFRPQPNAFSHPPSHLTHRHSTSSVPYYHSHHPSQSRPPMPNRPHSRSHRNPPNFMSPTYQADNDAALRASLTTLLSCAAAARGLPKHDERRTAVPGAGAGVVPSTQPMELRLVPESELMADSPPPAPAGTPSGKAPQQSTAKIASSTSSPGPPSSPSSRDHAEKAKRAATTQGKPARATKKKRTSATLLEPDTETETSPFSLITSNPTLLTWVVSAGVVVLVSVVGFGAGYVIGREVGRQEGAAGAFTGFGGGSANATAGCGSELVKSGAGGGGGGASAGMVRRIRWGGVGKSVAA
ncbi:hypothetical protein VTI74DRAFT_11558 [Chaetomium olivicolor]